MATYNMQTFLDTSRRRIKESRALLDIPKRACDGATTCALLAAECALKAALLYGLQALTLDDVSSDIRSKAFQSKHGHDLGFLYSVQDSSVQALWGKEEFEALVHLKQLDRFDHRYGAKRPKREHAEAAVVHAEAIVNWMTSVVT